MLAIIMKKFLDLTYYNNRDFIFPNHLMPTIEKSVVGIHTHYVVLSNSTYGEEVFEQFNSKSDIDLVENLINEHGVFLKNFSLLYSDTGFILFLLMKKILITCLIVAKNIMGKLKIEIV